MKRIKARYLMASILASAFAGFTVFACWVLNQSALPPGGGGWKLVILTPIVSWLMVFGLVLIHDKTKIRRFNLEPTEKES